MNFVKIRLEYPSIFKEKRHVGEKKFQRYIGKEIILSAYLMKVLRVGGLMELQNEVKYYLSRFGMSKSHMANALDISLQQLSAWTSEKLVLPDYHMEKIKKFIDTMKRVDEFLQQNNLVM